MNVITSYRFFPLTGAGRGEQLSELGMRPAYPVHGSPMGLPLVDVSVIAIGVIGIPPPRRRQQQGRAIRPQAVGIQVPDAHGTIAARGGESTAIVIEGNVEDVVEMAMGEGLGCRRQLERTRRSGWGGRGGGGGIHRSRQNNNMMCVSLKLQRYYSVP